MVANPLSRPAPLARPRVHAEPLGAEARPQTGPPFLGTRPSSRRAARGLRGAGPHCAYGAFLLPGAALAFIWYGCGGRLFSPLTGALSRWVVRGAACRGGGVRRGIAVLLVAPARVTGR